MKITFLLLLCTTFLHVFGQNFSPIPADLNLKRYTEMNAPINRTLNEATLSDNKQNRRTDLSNQLRSLVSSTNVQIIDSIYMWDWDSFNQEWLIDYRIVDIIYGADFLPASYVGQYLDNGEWINERRYSNTYTSNVLPLTEIEEVWDGVAWRYISQIIYEYDDQSNLTTFTSYNRGKDFWEISDRNLYTYDTANHLLTVVLQKLNVDVYENLLQYLYTYDKEGNRVYELYQSWMDDQWNDNFQVFNTFDHLSNQLYDLVEIYDGNQWINYSQSGFQHDAQNNRTYHIHQSWRGNEWVNEFQYYFTFDPANNPSTELEQKWNGTEWETYLTVSYTHDTDNFLISEVYSYYQKGETLVSFGDSTHYYYHSVTGLADVSPALNELIISPNPTTGLFAIDHTDKIVAVDVYSIRGAHIAHLEPAQDANHLDVNISGNHPGMYILRIRTKSAVYGAKVLLN